MTTSLPILVAVTGRGENTAALRFAAQEARRSGGEVGLLLVVHEVLPPPPPSVLMTSPTDWETAARRTLRDVGDELAEISGGTVRPVLLAHKGRPATVIVEESRSTGLVVLQHRNLSTLHRIFTGSTVFSVAAHAHCPVVSVPHTWDPASASGRVTVGVHEDGGPDAALEEAFGQAAARGAALRVVHAWTREGIYDDFVLSVTDDETTAERERRVQTSVGPLREKYPDVPVEVSVHHRWPADVLAELTATSDLMVVGRHGQHPPLPHTLGSMARAVLNAAACPVMVVPV